MVKGYSQVFKDCAVRMLVDCLVGDGACLQWRAVKEIAPKLGVRMSDCAVGMSSIL